MKLEEAIATSSTLFVKPLLWAKESKQDRKAENAIKKLEKMPEKEIKTEKDLDKILYRKYKYF